MSARGHWVVIASIAATVLVGVPSHAQGPAESVEVRVESDRLRIDHRARTAAFEGDVRASYGDLRIECGAMEVAYGDGGEVVSLKAKGGVTVRREDVVARARTARLDARLGLLVLEGSPSLETGAHRLEGARITVDLASGAIDVIKARGVFELGRKRGS